MPGNSCESQTETAHKLCTGTYRSGVLNDGYLERFSIAGGSSPVTGVQAKQCKHKIKLPVFRGLHT